jgi:hypothetical protein
LEYIVGVESEKQYDLETENRGSYLYAIVGGLRATPEIVLSYWHEIIGECDELGLSKILLEHNFVELISMNELVVVIGPVADMLKGHTFAFLDRYEHDDVPEAGKSILRSMNIKMQIFTDVEKAEKWLLAN